MKGRHESRRSRILRRPVLLVGVVLLTGAVGAATVVGLHLRDMMGCSGELPVSVAAAPDTEQVVRQVAADYERNRPSAAGRCVRIQVTPRNAAEVAAGLPNGEPNPPVLWIPDSSLWAQQAEQTASTGGATPRLEVRSSLVSTPLVVAGTDAAVRQLGWPKAPVSWQRLADGATPALISDPNQSTEGLATLAVMAGLTGSTEGNPTPALVATLLKLAHPSVLSVQDAFGRVQQDNPASPLFTATEQSVFAHDRQLGRRAVAAVYPQEGTIDLDHPVVRLRQSGELPGTDDAVNSFEQALRSPAALRQFTDAGFRGPDGTAPADWTDGDGVRRDPPKLLPTPTPTAATQLLKVWSVITVDARMLTVFDVSSAMRSKANGQSLIEMARDAAFTALGLQPDSSNIGSWAVSSRLPNGFVETQSIAPLGKQVGEGTQRAALERGLATLPGQVGGDSRMFDAALAGFRAVRASFDSSKVNSVVLFTAGDSDQRGGLDLPTLVQTLRNEQDPNRLVPIIAIGIGPNADMDALNQIASASGGKAYQATNATDIRKVLFNALVERQCRPHC
jgi:Ca-activated chloride channel family protein